MSKNNDRRQSERPNDNDRRRIDRPVVELFEKLCSRPVLTGEEAMMMIVDHCGGSRIRFPDHDDIYVFSRNRAIRKQRNKGASTTALMVEWNLSRPQVCRILNDGDED